MKQTSPVPMQSPAAIPELPLTLISMWVHMSKGADHKGDPSEPRTARMTPCTSNISPPFVPGGRPENVLKTTAGSVSLGCSRITTGVLITSLWSGYSTLSGVSIEGASGPSGVGHGHHQACSGGSHEPCGMKMQAGSGCLHCAVVGRH